MVDKHCLKSNISFTFWLEKILDFLVVFSGCIWRVVWFNSQYRSKSGLTGQTLLSYSS